MSFQNYSSTLVSYKAGLREFRLQTKDDQTKQNFSGCISTYVFTCFNKPLHPYSIFLAKHKEMRGSSRFFAQCCIFMILCYVMVKHEKHQLQTQHLNKHLRPNMYSSAVGDDGLSNDAGVHVGATLFSVEF